MNARRCDACDFDFRAVNPPDVPGQLASAVEGFRRELRGHDARVLRARPQPQTWSALEYACHVRDVLLVQRDRLYRALTEDTPDCVPMHRDERATLARYNDQQPARVAEQLAVAADLAAEAFASVDRGAWSRPLIYNWPERHLSDISGLAAHTVHETGHHFTDFQRSRATAVAPGG